MLHACAVRQGDGRAAVTRLLHSCCLSSIQPASARVCKRQASRQLALQPEERPLRRRIRRTAYRKNTGNRRIFQLHVLALKY
jgi:hypothetical protein